ncbi:MAG: thiamine phosphate synthase [Shimia sp.]
MADPEHPQLYLITPPQIELSRFPGDLSACLDAVPVACVRLSLATTDADALSRAADAVREVCHTRDIACVIETHVGMVERLGLDGVHLTDGSRSVRKARKELGEDAIVGAFCGTSRHDGMTAGEIGVDYVAFGPVEDSLGGETAPLDLFAWWSDMIELPVVAEGSLTPDMVGALAPSVDWLAFGAEVWDAESPVEALKALAQRASA